ncbi:hypothetical protein L249_1144 [Ophiocordyceps polyrhachis-furcata BCC 54312]|uniref:Uncharacterized protein n=1 Tax=Ophiocordyceps polyrhachis-furcata BCC 54312 TaxID=1330021 RepID=A0A367LDE7_9HYPO|nr:hypothetical protein L249_1144 [Ophiocordyceps polyrhachis-furcata BCC 54312]
MDIGSIKSGASGAPRRKRCYKCNQVGYFQPERTGGEAEIFDWGDRARTRPASVLCWENDPCNRATKRVLEVRLVDAARGPSKATPLR